MAAAFPNALDAVRQEGTPVLPFIFTNGGDKDDQN
jgi:hypothetical protein